MGGADYLARLYGDDDQQSVDHETGWQHFEVLFVGGGSGAHVIKLAAFNNKKTRADEVVRVRYDNIKVCMGLHGVDMDSPPVIYSVTTSDIYYNRANIHWTTNKPSDSQVEYGVVADDF